MVIQNIFSEGPLRYTQPQKVSSPDQIQEESSKASVRSLQLEQISVQVRPLVDTPPNDNDEALIFCPSQDKSSSNQHNPANSNIQGS